MQMKLQAQRTADGESSKAYTAYLIHRDYGVGRTMVRSYGEYLSTVGKGMIKAIDGCVNPSATFINWAKRWQWNARLEEWDNSLRNRQQSALLAADGDAYIAKVESLRLDIESMSLGLFGIVRKSAAIINTRLESIQAKHTDNESFKPMPKDVLEEFSSLVRSAKDIAGILLIASEKLSESLGLQTVLVEMKSRQSD
jgi:hypothetical protein